MRPSLGACAPQLAALYMRHRAELGLLDWNDQRILNHRRGRTKEMPTA
jgi:hypothetical protein